jgi:lysozyme
MLKGIDTSHFSSFNQPQLNDMVKANQLYFNFIKVSEGMTVKDPRFTDIWQMSRKAGLICGAYHFFRPLADAAAQASNFIAQYKQVTRAGVLPPVIDMEWSSVKINGAPVEQWKQLLPRERIPKIKIFLSALEMELKVKPIIYTATGFWKEFIEAQSTDADNEFFGEYGLWIVDLNRNGKVPKPWFGKTASFIQTHFGEKATTQELFDKSDQDEFSGDIKSLLNITVPGFTIMNGFPFSNVVISIQQKLIQLQLLTGDADGLFGNSTETAIKQFQQNNGLFNNGIVDAQTWNKLL